MAIEVIRRLPTTCRNTKGWKRPFGPKGRMYLIGLVRYITIILNWRDQKDVHLENT